MSVVTGKKRVTSNEHQLEVAYVRELRYPR